MTARQRGKNFIEMLEYMLRNEGKEEYSLNLTEMYLLIDYSVAMESENQRLQSHLAKAEAIIEKAKKVETVLRIEHGHRVAEVNFGYLFDALREYDAQGGET